MVNGTAGGNFEILPSAISAGPINWENVAGEESLILADDAYHDIVICVTKASNSGTFKFTTDEYGGKSEVDITVTAPLSSPSCKVRTKVKGLVLNWGANYGNSVSNDTQGSVTLLN
jgi:hypothetical protein